MPSSNSSFLSYFTSVSEPRQEAKVIHRLDELFLVTLCSVISGADNWVAVEEYGKAKLDFLKKFLPFTNGIASHDTFTTVFSLIDAKEFEACFIKWTNALVGAIDGVIAIDGKTLRRSYSTEENRKAIHIISAWACSQSVVLGQMKVDDKSNEITAIPKLLELLDIGGCIITIDAMGCQKKIAESIIDKDANYILAVKGNHGSLNDTIERFFTYHKKYGFKIKGYNFTSYEETNGDHGRIEVRKYWATDDISWLKHDHNWPGLTTVIMVESTRLLKDKTTTEIRYYISSLKPDAKQIGKAIRSHWQVENKLHWVLDVIFNEDQARIRRSHGAENFAIVRRIALNILKKDQAKKSLAIKRVTAGWSDTYMAQLLVNI